MRYERALTAAVYAVGIATVVIASGVLSCSPSTEPSHLTYLPGTWEWLASVDVQTQQRHTPASEGFTARLQFTPEGERAGTFRYSRNTQIAVESKYGIAYEDAPGNDFIRLNASIDYLKEVAWISVGEDTLRLRGVMELGFNSVYVRVRE